MFANYNHRIMKKTQLRRRGRRNSGQNHRTSKVKQPSLLVRFRRLVRDLQRPDSHFSLYTVTELETVCQQIAIEQMSVSTIIKPSCPLTCLFCENLIYEPLTLYCGHTYCELCIKDEEFSASPMACPRCPKDIQGQIQSPVDYAREKISSKNHFLKQIFERSETLKFKRENILLCHQAQNEYANQNYQQALDIYSSILEKYDDDHTALYHRGKVYIALKELDKALVDIDRVIALKPKWAKGYYCRSEILFQMKLFTPALLSSLQALTLDPDDPIGKQIMARNLHAVLHNNDNNESTTPMGTELVESDTPSIDNIQESLTSEENKPEDNHESCASDTKLLMCRSPQSTSCLCTLFDCKNLRARDFECSVCVNLLWFPVTTPCGHIFCRECLIRSIDNTQAQCPMCKSSLEAFFPMLIQSHVNKTEVISQIIETHFPNEFNERRQLSEQERTQGGLISRSPTNDTESNIFEVPIFVCVLTLPQCTCPLHVFEPRYRLMMRRTVETESRTFGMCRYDEETDSFADYGTLLYIRGLVYTLDGRSIVDTIGQRRFRVIERDTRDGYHTARIQLIRDHSIEQAEFDDLCELNRNTYNRVRTWFDQLDAYRRTLISRQLEGYPPCDDLTLESPDGSSWTWVMLNLLPIEADLQYTALTSQSFRTRLQMINDTIDFLTNQPQQQIIVSSIDDDE